MAPGCGSPSCWAQVLVLALLLFSGEASCSGPGDAGEAARGRAELQRVRSYAAASRYGDCWTRALEQLDTRCRDMTSESQSRVALKFTHCHLLSSGRDFPSCPEGSEVSRCTAHMDVAAFNTFTEFFTHTHSICHFLQSEAWQNRAENTMYRLTESSAGVAEQLQSTRLMAQDLVEAQSAALQTQQEILSNGEELRATLKDSTQGLKSVFSELSAVSQQQQLALSELFNRVSFLQSFLMMEAHSMSSCLYNAAALGAAFLLTATSRTSRARLLLLALVCLNFYLERKIYEYVTSSELPEHQHMELVSSYISVLRRVVLSVSLLVLVLVVLRHRDPLQQSLMVLQQLQETQRSLQVALQHAENLGEKKRNSVDQELKVSSQKRKQERNKQEDNLYKVKSDRRKQEAESPTDQSDLSQLSLIEPMHEPEELNVRHKFRAQSEILHRSHWGPSLPGWSADSLLSSTVCSSAADSTVLAHDSQDATLLSSVSHDAPVQNSVSHDAPVQRPAVSPSRRQRRSSSSRRISSSGSPLVYSVLVEDKQSRYSLRSRRSETSRYFD